MKLAGGQPVERVDLALHVLLHPLVHEVVGDAPSREALGVLREPERLGGFDVAGVSAAMLSNIAISPALPTSARSHARRPLACRFGRASTE